MSVIQSVMLPCHPFLCSDGKLCHPWNASATSVSHNVYHFDTFPTVSPRPDVSIHFLFRLQSIFLFFCKTKEKKTYWYPWTSMHNMKWILVFFCLGNISVSVVFSHTNIVTCQMWILEIKPFWTNSEGPKRNWESMPHCAAFWVYLGLIHSSCWQLLCVYIRSRWYGAIFGYISQQSLDWKYTVNQQKGWGNESGGSGSWWKKWHRLTLVLGS